MPVASDEQNRTNGDKDVPEGNTDVWIAASDSVDLEGMNMYWQQDNLQFSADNAAKLSLYVNADKDDKGNFMLDDGNSWMMLMETSLGKYPLLPKQYVQLGGVIAPRLTTLRAIRMYL